MRRLEELAAEKSALLERLSETERKGAEASGAAERLRAEVENLKTQLEDAREDAAAGAESAEIAAFLEEKLRDLRDEKSAGDAAAEGEIAALRARGKPTRARRRGRPG